MGCFGSTTVQAPKPTPQETSLENDQLNAVNQENALTEATLPLEFQAMGYNLSNSGTASNPNYSISPMTQDQLLANMNPLQQQQYNNGLLSAQQENLALQGKMPIDQNLENQLQLQQQQLSQTMAEKLGPNWQQTTSGQQALQQLNTQQNITRQAVATGQLNSLNSVNLGQMGFAANQQAQNEGALSSTSQYYAPSFNMAGAAMQPYQYYNQMGFQANMANAQNSANEWAGLGSLFGQVGGSLAGNSNMFKNTGSTSGGSGSMGYQLQLPQFGANADSEYAMLGGQ